MSTAMNPVALPAGLEVIDAVSFFCREGNHDKEYHIQRCSYPSPNGVGTEWCVNYQFGARGSKLQSRQKAITYSAQAAASIFADMCNERTRKNYRKLKLGEMSGVLRELDACGLSRIGLDLYMQKGNHTFPLKDYMKGATWNDVSSVAHAYSGKKALMAAAAVVDFPEDDEIQESFEKINRALDILRFSDFGIFIGHENENGIVKGLPDIAALRAARENMRESGATASAARNKPAGGFSRRAL